MGNSEKTEGSSANLPPSRRQYRIKKLSDYDFLAFDVKNGYCLFLVYHRCCLCFILQRENQYLGF